MKRTFISFALLQKLILPWITSACVSWMPNAKCSRPLLQALQQAEQLTELRRKGGLASDYDVYQAKTLLDQTDAQAQHIEIQRAQFEHVIAVLTGQPASTFSSRELP